MKSQSAEAAYWSYIIYKLRDARMPLETAIEMGAELHSMEDLAV